MNNRLIEMYRRRHENTAANATTKRPPLTSR